jgi:hypothetical protein
MSDNPRLSDLPDHPDWKHIQANPLDPAFIMSPEELAILQGIFPDPYRLHANTAELLEADLTAFTETIHGTRDDGFALLYPGSHATIYGEPGSGKTLLAKYISSQAINAGKRVLHVDVDGNFGAVIVQDVYAFGTERQKLIDNYRLAQPDTLNLLLEVILDAQAHPFDLVILDSVASLQAFTSTDGDKATEYVQRVYQRFVAPLMAVGSTVITIDHTGKDEHVKGASGSVQKMAKADLAFRAVPKGTGLQRGKDGRVDIMLEKDRYSTVKAASVESTGGSIHAASFVIPASGMLGAKLTTPDGAITPNEPSRAPAQDTALDALVKAGKPLSWQEWQTKSGMGADSFRKAAKRLLESGQVENNNAGIYAPRRVAI